MSEETAPYGKPSEGRLNLNLFPDDLHKTMRIYVAQHDMSLKRLVIESVKEYMARHK